MAKGSAARLLIPWTIAAAAFGYTSAFLQYSAPEWACGAFSSSNTASWVQGVGTVLAVLGAVWVALWQRSQDKSDARRQKTIKGRVVALNIWPSVKSWRSIVGTATVPRRGDELANFQFLNGVATSGSFHVPKPVREAVNDFYLFDDEGDHLLLATLIAEDGGRRLERLHRKQNGYGERLYETSADDEIAAVHDSLMQVEFHLQNVGPRFLVLLASSWGDHPTEDRLARARTSG